jgi:hypothetical protein
MSTFIIKQEFNSENQERFAAYEMLFNGETRYVDGSFSNTQEECEGRLRTIVASVRTSKVVNSIEL